MSSDTDGYDSFGEQFGKYTAFKMYTSFDPAISALGIQPMGTFAQGVRAARVQMARGSFVRTKPGDTPQLRYQGVMHQRMQGVCTDKCGAAVQADEPRSPLRGCAAHTLVCLGHCLEPPCGTVQHGIPGCGASWIKTDPSIV